MSDKPEVHFWEVTVFINGDDVLTIGSNHLSGIENIADYDDTIRTCAHNLLGFIGDPAPSTFLGDVG